MAAVDLAASIVKKFEGCKLIGYLDAGGIPTIGWGHTGPGVFVGQVITQEQADAFLLSDLHCSVVAVAHLCPPLQTTMNRQAAIIDFCYNEGAGRLEGSTLRKLILAGQYEAVPAELAKWVFDHGVRLPGLVNRRTYEGAIWNTVDPPPT